MIPNKDECYDGKKHGDFVYFDYDVAAGLRYAHCGRCGSTWCENRPIGGGGQFNFVRFISIPTCHKESTITCPTCKRTNSNIFDFCGYCGAKLIE